MNDDGIFRNIICLLIALLIAFVILIALYSTHQTGSINTKTASDTSSTEDYIFVQVPGENGHLIYIKNTQAVYITWSDETYSAYPIDNMVPFLPAYGYGGTYVYFLPDENMLVNENGVEVPGILRKVGDRP